MIKAAVGLAMLASCSAQAEIAIIANVAYPENQISAAEAQQLWLGKFKTLGKSTAVVADQQENSTVRGEFSVKILGQSERQVRAYWSREMFTGRATPPEVLGSDAEVKRWVGAQADGLGYIDGAAVDGSVKVLLRVQ